MSELGMPLSKSDYSERLAKITSNAFKELDAIPEAFSRGLKEASDKVLGKGDNDGHSTN